MQHHGVLISLLLLCAFGSSTCQEVVQQGSFVDDVLSERPSGVNILYEGPIYQDFDLPLPTVVETTLFEDFEGFYNATQEFYGDGTNTYLAEGRQFVVSIKEGRVTGVLGNVYDAQGRVFTEFATSMVEVEESESMIGQAECKHFKKLATSIQKYGHMYYHFLQEVMPRIVLLQPFLDADTKLLVFGAPYEMKWLAELGITADQVEVYDPAVQYCADELLVPTMSPVITPPKENYELVRTAFQVNEPLPEEARDLVIYCSRSKAGERHVANEDQVLEAIKQQHHALPGQLYVYTGDESVVETIQLFRRARVVVGIHGAGLSHIIFSAPGTAVVEFLFMYDPPMMFWHTSAALSLDYVMVPLAQSWWLDQDVNVPVQDVLDALALAMGDDEGQCELGFAMDAASGACVACPAATYRPVGATSCLPCAPGKYASFEGSEYCTTCPAGTFSENGVGCVFCREGTTTMFPGSTSEDACIEEGEVDLRMDEMFDQDTLMKKLVAFPAWHASEPKTVVEWISAKLSPSRMLQAWHQKDLSQQYIKLLLSDGHDQLSEEDMFNDEIELSDEGRTLLASGNGYTHGNGNGDGNGNGNDNGNGNGNSNGNDNGNGNGRSMLQYSVRRSLLQSYNGRRALLQSYNSGRSLMQSYSVRRSLLMNSNNGNSYGNSNGHGRSLLQSYSGRRSLLQSYNGRRTMLQSYNGHRSLLQSYSVRRSLLMNGNNGNSYGHSNGHGRSLLQNYAGRRSLLQSYNGRRTMLQSYTGRRSLLMNGNNGNSYGHNNGHGRSLLQSYAGRRSLLQSYAGRRSLLQSYSVRRSLLMNGNNGNSYGHSNGHGRSLLVSYRRSLLSYRRSLLRSVLSYKRALLGSYRRNLLSYRRHTLQLYTQATSSWDAVVSSVRRLLGL